MSLVPLPDSEESPGLLSCLRHVRTPPRVDLHEVPLGTIIEFWGVHGDSKYIMQVVGPNTKRRVKIWFKGQRPCAIGPIDEIISKTFVPRRTEEGVLEIGKNYFLPHFYYDLQSGRLSINEEMRTEVYTKIFLRSP